MLLIRKEKKNSTYIIVYIDDILVASENQIIETIIKQLKSICEVKNLRDIGNNLGTEIKKINKGYILNQKLKTEKLTEKLNLENAKLVDTPMDPGFHKLEDDDNLLPNNTKFREAIGSLLYSNHNSTRYLGRSQHT